MLRLALREAYVASEDAKVIRIAAAPLANRMCCSCWMTLLPLSLGFILGALANVLHWDLSPQGADQDQCLSDAAMVYGLL